MTTDRPTFPYPHRTVEEVEARYHELNALSRRRALTDAESRELEREMIALGLHRRHW